MADIINVITGNVTKTISIELKNWSYIYFNYFHSNHFFTIIRYHIFEVYGDHSFFYTPFPYKSIPICIRFNFSFIYKYILIQPISAYEM